MTRQKWCIVQLNRVQITTKLKTNAIVQYKEELL